MEKIMPNGTEVLIFRYIRGFGFNQDEDDQYIIGIIKSSETSDDLSYHGSPYYEQIYEVLGEDGETYISTHNSGVMGNFFFRTREEHINVLKRKIITNNENILKIQEKNNEYNNQIALLEKNIKRKVKIKK